MKTYNSRRMGILTALLFTAAPSFAQEQEQVWQEPGQVVESAVGEVGQRQTREQTQANITPIARINNRISNRVQNRIRNRVDRYYNPQANTTSPFEVAADQARAVGAQPRR